jgi:hypothetical protein
MSKTAKKSKSVEDEVDELTGEFLATLDAKYRHLSLPNFYEDVLKTVRSTVDSRVQGVKSEIESNEAKNEGSGDE